MYTAMRSSSYGKKNGKTHLYQAQFKHLQVSALYRRLGKSKLIDEHPTCNSARGVASGAKQIFDARQLHTVKPGGNTRPLSLLAMSKMSHLYALRHHITVVRAAPFRSQGSLKISAKKTYNEALRNRTSSEYQNIITNPNG